MKIAILYICTGKYTIFWEPFHRSCEQYFLPGMEKHYFVFTDGWIPPCHERIHRIDQKNLGWPGNVVYRFHIFWRIREQLEHFDYIYFFNANCEFLAPIGTEFLPSAEEGLVVVQHPCFFNQIPDNVTYDRNPKSQAYIPFGQGTHYACGAVNGGRSKDYLALIASCREAVGEDDKEGVVALWHDESHLNKYILSHSYKLLSPAYCYPEDWNLPFEKIILIKDKAKFGGHGFMRGLIDE